MQIRKSIYIIGIVLVLLAIIIAALLIGGNTPVSNASTQTIGYEDKMFDQERIHSIDIFMEDWEGFLESCVDEEYTTCSVVINGERLDNVGIRAKGNSSLTEVAEMESSRYSLKLEFDHYISGQTYHGLDKLNLNNLIQDNTMMKDYLSYQLMRELGVASPLCSYTKVYVNHKSLGLYLAVEAVEESFLLRNYGNKYGTLYKPDAEGGQDNADQQPPPDSGKTELRGQALRQALEKQRIRTDRLGNVDWDTVTLEELPDLLSSLPGVDVTALLWAITTAQGPENGFDPLRDVKLQYIDDNPESYPNIFSNAKTTVTKSDQNRLIQSLQQLSTGKNLQNTVDIDSVIAYFVVHSFVCNEDSYTGPTVHNYYLYEKDGLLSMLPWDYNLAFGGMATADVSAVINSSIYQPVSEGGYSDRPMLSWILESKKYTWLYERYYLELLKVKMVDLVDRTSRMISPYVIRDPSKFCTYEEFEIAVETLKQFLELRSESVQLQLRGQEAALDVGELDLSAMGGVGGKTALPSEPSKK